MTHPLRAALMTSTALALAWTLPATPARAQDATWLASPGSNIYNTGTNWSPSSVPTGTAYFGTSSQTNLSLATAVAVGRWYFDVGASSYTFNIGNSSGLSFTGNGIVVWGGGATINNNGGSVSFYNSSVSGAATINNSGLLSFWDMSAAGGTINNNNILSFYGNSFSAATIINNHFMAFQETSFAGAGTFITNNGNLWFKNQATGGTGSFVNSAGAHIDFEASSSAESATIANSGSLYFSSTSTAGSASITNAAAAYMNFNNSSSAGNATITNNSDLIFSSVTTAGSASVTNNSQLYFNDASTAGSASIINNAGAYLTFRASSSADGASITNNAGATVNFNNSGSAGSASITNNGLLYFNDTSTAGSAAITNSAGATVNFNNTSAAGNAAIINDGIVDFSPGLGPNSDNKQSVGSIAGAGQYFLGANELTVGSNNLSTTVTGGIADGGSAGGTGGSLVKVGTGVLALAGTNTYTGGTTITAGTLQLGDGGTTGSVVGNIVDNGVLAFNRSDAVTFSNVISGSGAVQQIGSGTTILTADMSYTGGTTITAGTLQIGNGGTAGWILGNVVNDGVLAFNRSDTITFAGDISGSGAVKKMGSNTTILTGANSYAGITTIAAGTLQIGNGGTTGSLAGNVVNDGVLTINRSDAVTLPGDISGSGSLRQVGSGTTILTGNNSYTGGTTIAAGTLQIGSGGTSGSIVGDIANDGVLAFNRSNTLTLAVNISGSGSVRQIGSGTTILTGTNTYSGDTTVSGGRLQFGDGSAGVSTNLAGNINVTGGTLAIQAPATLNVAQTVTFGNNTALSIVAGTNSPTLSADGITIGSGVAFNVSGISDASQLDKVLIDTRSGISGDFANVTIGGFSGTVDYLTMSVRKSADGLQYLASYGLSWTAGNSLAHGTFTLTNATDTFTLGVTLTDQAANAATGWDGKSLTKAGAGTLILTGHNTYSGGTTVSGGTLQIGNSGATGSILGTVTVNSGATFELVNADMSGVTNLANSGLTNFRNSVSAGNASIANTGQLTFYDTSTAGTATITNGGNLTFNNSSSAGSATIANNSNLYFWHTASAGSALIDNLGTTNFNDTSSAGTATINNLSGATLAFNGSSTASGANISNSANLNFNNSASAGSAAITNTGTLEFRDVATAANAQITTTGTTNFRNASSAGNATLTVTGSYYSDLTFYDTSTAGSATINVSTANLYFRDSSTAGSANIVNDGKIITWNSATLGNATITNNTLLDVYGSSSAGNATITNNRWIYFDDSATAGTATILNNYSLNFWSNSSAGSAHITNAAAGTLEIVNSATLANATVINSGQMSFWGGNVGDIPTAGHATITNNASGTIEFRNSSTAGSATVINDGQMRFTSQSTAGSATITNNSQLTFDTNTTAGSAVIRNSGHVLFDGNSTPGDAQLINNTSGAVFDLSMSPGPNSDNKLTAGSLAGGGTFYLGGKELTVGSSNLSTTVTGALADGGSGGYTGASLVKTGTGRLTLSGVNTYTGATIVDGGTLAVNGSIASSSSLTVNSGGTLGGTGAVGTTTIASGGTLAPGNSIGTLTVSGNLAFSAGSFYRVEVSTTAADRTNVSGIATLSGATVQAVAIPGSFRSQTYTILNATGGFGGTQFAGLSVTGSFSPTRNPHLTYDLNNVYLVLDPGAIVLPAGTGANQSNVAGAINGAVASGATPPAGFDALLNMGQPQLNRGLSQVSGQPGAAGTQAAFNATQQFVGMLDPLGGGGSDGERGGTVGDGGTLGYASTAPNDPRVREAYAAVSPRDVSGDVIDRRWGVWASAYGGASTLNGNTAAGSSTTTSRIYGTVVGADYRVSPNTLLGFALGGAGYNFALSDSLGSGRADLFQAGLYARHNFGPAYLSAALAYGWQDVTTDRTVTVSGTDKLTANFKASTFSGRLEGGWRFASIPASSFGVTPYAAAQVTTFHLPGYGETTIVGSNQFALSYTAQDTTNVRTELGARTDQRFLVNDGVLTLRGRLAWAHDSNTNRLVSAAFQTLPGAAFTVNGAQPAADSALVGGRAEMKWRNGLSLAGTVEGEFSQSTQTYTGKGTVRYEW
ncbi:autotransporter-associated beta strand repeat-containing protein [Bradyrhizobium huanghuaihaiense]|uniref:autotransporter-associated beta strand repeat-containing protein n=1 Tax=Bradyrhizobium huanghuaihaiense TaxID=990078 RepID=UPI0021A9EAD4|nr:autotransporter-associated beta strand repeat-containing protein [Bradyrhizobium sp. CB3035]UWU73758.1 autotransporter-associated beta strand repeat-containing protein [Bradyrhizobium sp. CB3035]